MKINGQNVFIYKEQRKIVNKNKNTEMIDPPFPTNPVPHLSISHIIERVTH